MRIIYITLASILLSCGQGSADKKVKQLAGEMCSCFDEFKKNISEKEMQVFITVSTAANPQQAITNTMRQMNPDEANAFADKLKTIGDKNAPLFQCLQAFDKKHGQETTKDKQALTQNLLHELHTMNCTIGAAIMNLSLGKMKTGKQ